MRYWPTAQDYNEAIQNPHACFSDPELSEGAVELNALGLPKSANGAFASVYKISNGAVSWAVRCFLTDRAEQKERYKHISDFVLFDDLECTVDFHYLDKGIKVKNEWYPCLKMTWVEGVTLDQYIDKNLSDEDKMKWLLQEFHKLVGELEGAGIAHGDLQHGNIMVLPQGLRLVDYDALFVPALAGKKCLELGHPNYQHPARTEFFFDPDVDNFSCWLIHGSILALVVDPQLYKDLGGGDECILLRRSDLANPQDSPVFNALLSHPSSMLRDTGHLLMRMLWAAPEKVPYLGAPFEKIETLPNKPPAVSSAPAPPEPQIDSEITYPSLISSDLSHIYDVVDGRSSSKQWKGKKPILKRALSASLLAGRSARDRIEKIASDIERGTAPETWLKKRLQQAKADFLIGEYDSAVEVLLEIYRGMDRESVTNQLHVIACLGFTYAMMGRLNQAANYFLLGVQRSKDERDISRLLILALAVTKYREGNEEAAFKILEDNLANLPAVSQFLDPIVAGLSAGELAKTFFLDVSTSDLLFKFAKRLFERNSKDESGKEFLKAARLVILSLLAAGRLSSAEEELCRLSFDLGAHFCHSNNFDLAQELFSNLATACRRAGLLDQERLAKFCLAIAFDSAGDRLKATEFMTELATVSSRGGDDESLSSLPRQAKDFFSPDVIILLLLNLSTHFYLKYATAEGAALFKVAYQFQIANKSLFVDQTISASGNVDEETLFYCLHDVHVRYDTDFLLRDQMLKSLINKQSVKPIISLFNRLMSTRNESWLVDLIRLIALNDQDGVLFKQIVKSTTGFANLQESDRAALGPDKIAVLKSIEDCCGSCARQCFAHLTAVVEELSGLPAASRRLQMGNSHRDKIVSELEIISGIKGFFHTMGSNNAAHEITERLSGQEYKEVLAFWQSSAAGAGDNKKLAKYALVLAETKQIDGLQDLVRDLVRKNQRTAVKEIANCLSGAGYLPMLFDLAEEFVAHNEIQAFKCLLSELADRADDQAFASSIEKITAKFSRQSAICYAQDVIRQLNTGPKVSILAQLLVRMHERGNLQLVGDLGAVGLIGTTYSESVFNALLARRALGTIGEVVFLIASRPIDEGLKPLIRMLRSGAVKTAQIYAEFLDAALAHCSHELDALREKCEPEQTEDAESDTSADQVEALDRVMQSMFNLRTFLASTQLQENHKGMINKLASERYDGLRVVWLRRLVDRGELRDLGPIVMELAEHENVQCLKWLVNELAKKQQTAALNTMTEQLMQSRHASVALTIAEHLIESELPIFQSIASAIIEKGTEPDTFEQLICLAARKSARLADLLSRQIALAGKTSYFKGVARKLAGEGEVEALLLVLEQLLAANQISFSLDFDAICDSAGDKGIKPLAQWLVSLNLLSVIKQRIALLQSRNRMEEARLWTEYLPQEQSDG